jgi:Mn2+/Fe2+ NRAMP family transporter
MTDSKADSVAMTMPEPDPKLKAGKFKDLLRYLGPGIIVASASIGNGEIFFASREGALFGFSLLWTFVVCAFMKGCVVYTGSKFATLTGEHPTVRWGQIIPGPKNWTAIFLGIVAAVAIPSSICGFIKVLGQWTCWTFGVDPKYTVLCGTVWALIAFLFVFLSYEKMEKVSTGIVLVLVIFALLAIFVSNPDWLALIQGFLPTVPAQYPEWVQVKDPKVLSSPILLEIVSAVGILGGGCQDYLGYMGTMSEKKWGIYGNEHIADIQESLKRLSGKEEIPLSEDENTVSDSKGWLKAVKIDNIASFTAVWLVGSIFMILGNVVLGTNGLQIVPSNDQVIQNQANFFSIISPALVWLYKAAIFCAFFGGTVALSTQVYPATFRACFSPSFPAINKEENKFKTRLWVAVFCIFGGILLAWTNLTYTFVLQLATVVGSVFGIGLVGLLMLWTEKRSLPKEYRLKPVWFTLTLLSSIVMVLLGVIAFLQLFGII